MNQEIQDLKQKLSVAAEGPEVGRRPHIQALNELAWAIRDTEPTYAFSLIDQAGTLLKLNPSSFETARMKRTYTYLKYVTGEYSESLQMGEEVLASSTPADLEILKPDLFNAMGCACWCLGDLPEANSLFRKQLESASAQDDKENMAEALNNMAIIHSVSGDHQLTLDTLLKSLERFQEIGSSRGIGLVYNNMGMCLIKGKKFEAALEHARLAVEIACEIENTHMVLTARDTVARIHYAAGAIESALAEFLEVSEIAGQYGFEIARAFADLGIGRIYRDQERWQDALHYLLSVLEFFQGKGHKNEVYESHQLLSFVYEATGDLSSSLTHLKKYCEVKEAVFNEEVAIKLKNMELKYETDAVNREAEIHRLKNVELQQALDKVKQLSGLLPICAKCKKIRDDGGYWQDVSVYIRDHSEADFSHGICPDCVRKFYPEYAERILKRGGGKSTSADGSEGE